VGSAAFNLLVISGVSILAVEKPKKVKDTGVFAVTSIASLFAYIWLYLVLSSISPGEVTMAEGWLTLVFFFLLIVFAYWADKVNAYIEENKQTTDEIEEKDK
jgi:solute carrier family 8 (sodium/calcium exchanger)